MKKDNKLKLLLASGFYLGLSPVVPGSFGALSGLVWHLIAVLLGWGDGFTRFWCLCGVVLFSWLHYWLTPWAQKYHSMSVEPSASMKLALALVDDVRANLPVDPARIYATGISMGGYGTWDAVQRRPGLFAAALPICGGGDTACAMRIRDVPIWCFHGDADGAVPVCRSRNMVAALWAVDGKIRYREYPGVGHNCWARTYGDDAVLAWLFSQRKGK